MNKEEILDEINKTKEHLANMEKMLEKGDEMWKPEKGEMFYYLNSYNIAISETWNADYSNAAHYNIYNCFQTKEQAEQEAEKILIRRQLEDIARRLNKGIKIDWNNTEQSKYCIELYFNNIVTNFYYGHKTQGTVYCLDENFKDVAIQQIGEGRLIKYLRGK